MCSSDLEVLVEAVIGQIGVNGRLQGTYALPLVYVGEAENGKGKVFASEFIVQQTGRVGYSVRITPNHFDQQTRPCNALLKWVSD